jgi:hypothetical protein
MNDFASRKKATVSWSIMLKRSRSWIVLFSLICQPSYFGMKEPAWSMEVTPQLDPGERNDDCSLITNDLRFSHRDSNHQDQYRGVWLHDR